MTENCFASDWALHGLLALARCASGILRRPQGADATLTLARWGSSRSTAATVGGRYAFRGDWVSVTMVGPVALLGVGGGRR